MKTTKQPAAEWLGQVTWEDDEEPASSSTKGGGKPVRKTKGKDKGAGKGKAKKGAAAKAKAKAAAAAKAAVSHAPVTQKSANGWAMRSGKCFKYQKGKCTAGNDCQWVHACSVCDLPDCAAMWHK